MGIQEVPVAHEQARRESRRGSVTASIKMAVDHTEDLKEQQLRQHDGGDYSGAQGKTDPAEIKLVKKLDLWIMVSIYEHSRMHKILTARQPTLWIMYWLNYLDRNAITLARLNNLEEELNLTSTQYQTCVSILFVGYILGQVPSNLMLTRVRPSIWSTFHQAMPLQ